MKYHFADELVSDEQLGMVLLELRNYVGKMHDRNVKHKIGQVQPTSLPVLTKGATALLRVNKVKAGDAEAIESLVKELERARKKMLVARIQLAAHPDEAQAQQLVNWFRSHVDSHALLSITVRPDIGGGAIVQVGGHKYDFSFKTLLLHNQQHVSEVLARG